MEKNLLDLTPDFKDNPKLFSDLGQVEGFVEYLRDTMDADIRRSFDIEDDMPRHLIKGHYSLAKYLVDKIIAHKKAKDLTKVS